MGLIRSLINSHKQKVQERNDACASMIAEIDCASSSINALFSDTQNFIEPQQANIWINQNTSLLNRIAMSNIVRLRKAERYTQLVSIQNSLLNMVQMLPQRIQQHNNHVAEARVQAAYTMIGNVEGRQLDFQQMTCIVKESYNHLVIAGAGTGKTTTVVGKIKFLLKSEKCKPEDILVLSFTNASATEMRDRIQSETGCNIAASTFHKLGLNIISQADEITPKISQLKLRAFIKEQLQNLMKSDAYMSLLSSYLLYNKVVAKSEFDFTSEQEYKEYLTLNPPATLNHETVKSYGEMDIANFLTQNGIRYIYEHPYEVDTRTSEYGQYHPDFYLPDYNIYIEYFGIDKNGEVPSYFKGTNGMTATQAYQASMAWKRQLHKEHNTKMIECFAYEKFDGTLLETLKNKLTESAVTMAPQSADELWKQISAEGESVLDGMIELFETLINLIKSNGYDISTVRRLNAGGIHCQANNTLLSLLEPIFNSYCAYLHEHQEIDFNDMINLATQYVQNGRYINPYKYVIVDEYQDISKARFNLLNSLRRSNNFELFCVGDDWQSIYRFAGSDIGYILNFSKYWGATEVSRIETTYRFSQKLIEISGGFIMQNPVQIKKSIRGKSDDAAFPLGEISGYTEKYAVEFMTKKLDDLPKESSVFFIGRYAFDAKLLSESDMLSCRYNNTNGIVEVTYRNRLDLKMSFITAHKSKGLQADYIFIINNKRSRMGFPSKIQDAPILNLLLDNCDQYPYAEERRLFYVALTRAKKKAYLMTVNGQESEFAMELKRRYGEEIKREQFTCPICGGKLLKKAGPYGEFFGCSNYRTKGCTYKRKIMSRHNNQGN
ncbi:MAG: UvrD-helicase domain-containing protein [Oscillospiraceae bacterium]|nr:UvrD-helicase domain-containing protein [Oscillospiraceae bacterium]